LHNARGVEAESYKSEEALRNQMATNELLLQQVVLLEHTARQNEERIRALNAQVVDASEAVQQYAATTAALQAQLEASSSQHKSIVEELSLLVMDRDQQIESKVRTCFLSTFPESRLKMK